MRGGCTPGSSRLGQLAAARAHQEASARARGLHHWQFAPVAARFARAHRTTSARPRGLHPWQFAARGRAGRAAFLRSARAGPSAKARWRNVKVFSQVFFKKLVGFGVKPQDLTGVRGRSHRLPLLQKKGGRMSPSWGGTETGVLLVEGAGWVPPRPLPGLSPVGRVRPVRCFSSTGCAG